MKKYILNYFEDLASRKLQFRFLVGLSMFSISLLAIVFGLNSMIIEDFTHPGMSNKTNFLDLKNILNFPFEQHKLQKTAMQISSLKDSTQQSQIEDFLIIDVTGSIENKVYKPFLDTLCASLSPQIAGKLAEMDVRALLAELIYRTRNRERFELYYLIGNTNNQSLGSASEPKIQNEYANLGKDINSFIKDHNSQPGDTDYYQLFRDVEKLFEQKKLKKDSKYRITIISDFENERDNAKFFELINRFDSKYKSTQYRLIRMPLKKKKDESQGDFTARNNAVTQFIKNWYKTSSFEIIVFDKWIKGREVKKTLKRFFPNTRIAVDSTLNLVYPAIRPNNIYDYREADRIIEIPTGNYLINLKTKSASLYQDLPIELTGPNSKRRFLSNNIPLRVNGGEIELSAYDSIRYGSIGSLEIFNMDEETSLVYPIWAKKRLNKTGIGWYIILLNTFCFSLYWIAFCGLSYHLRQLVPRKNSIINFYYSYIAKRHHEISIVEPSLSAKSILEKKQRETWWIWILFLIIYIFIIVLNLQSSYIPPSIIFSARSFRIDYIWNKMIWLNLTIVVVMSALVYFENHRLVKSTFSSDK